MIEVESRRGKVTEPAKIGDILPGHLFIPFHYGYWDNPGRSRAANELTIAEWDPISKQPQFKYSAVKISKVKEGILHKAGEALGIINDQPQKMEV